MYRVIFSFKCGGLMKYHYVIEKIKQASIQHAPFAHIEIDDLFDPADFQEITSSPDIQIDAANDDAALFKSLFDRNYRIIDFPGCVSDYKKYIDWHKHKDASHLTNTSCEGYGVVLRLTDQVSGPIKELSNFLYSPEFIRCIAEKFGVDHDACKYDAGIQKYLDGYEISPHPDIRRKALTFMVNINPNPESEAEDHHTHYMQFIPDRSYIREFWAGNPKRVDTCWVPWNWCETLKQQTKNNSIVIFSPNSETLHGVKANYNHLTFQRTQLYGNLWHQDLQCDMQPQWEDLDLIHFAKSTQKTNPLFSFIKDHTPGPLREVARTAARSLRSRSGSAGTHTNRTY